MQITNKLITKRVFISLAVLAFMVVIPDIATAAIGDTIVLTQNSDVSVKFTANNAYYNDLVGLSSPKNISLIRAQETPVGSQFSLGNFSAGTELIFFLNNTKGQTWFSGPSYRNSDHIAHANVFSIGNNQWQLNFEDLPKGGDQDYNDVEMVITASPSCISHLSKKCVGNAIYWYNSCNVKQDLYQQCTTNQICQNKLNTLLPDAECVNINIACSTNSQCGTNGFIDSPYCQANSVYQNYKTYTCNNPGTANSICSNSIAPQLKTTCSSNQTCSNGTCTNVNIACSANTDCGINNYTGGPYCLGNGVYKNYTTYTCNNAGTASSSCSNSTTPKLQNTCNSNQTCSLGSCANVNIACSANTDCGISGYTGGSFCQNNSVYQNYKTYTCNNPGTANSSCSNSTALQLINHCASNQTCSNGSCENINIACSSDSACGASGYTGGPFCMGNGVYKNYKTYTCNSPGTANSSCSNSTTPQLINHCTANQTCSLGSCTDVNVACSANTDCGTSGYIDGLYCQGNNIYQNYKTYTCNNPGTANSSCSNSIAPQLKSTCSGNQTCSNGTCSNVNIACSANTDCGTNGFIDSPYCQANSVYQNYKTYTCNNPGTANSICNNSIAPQLKNSCTGNQTCSNGSCTNQQNNLVVSTSVYPTSPQVNQSVTFTSSVTGGIGNYTYSWTGACTGYSANCYISFPQSGTYTAYLLVTSGNQTQTSTQAVTVGQNCNANTTQRCIGNAVYWYDSCGNQQGLIQTCNSNQTCSNGYCSQQQNYITVQTNPATSINNSQAILNGYLSGISSNNINYVWFQWGNNSSYGFETNHQTMNYTGSFNQSIAGLSPGVVYHFRAVAQDYNNQTVYGQDMTFQAAQVLGATYVPTGLTNNFLVDSFFLPLIIGLAGIWLFRSGILNFSGWTDSYRIKRRNYIVGKKLKSKITEIREKEDLN